jgi:hypothetical protein
MLFFRSEEHIKRWCESKGLPVRPTVNLEQLWFLSVTWYGNRLTVDSRRPKPDEMAGIFAQIGLRGEFWDPTSDRFE